jgi:Acetyltransferase (GNAT) domain
MPVYNNPDFRRPPPGLAAIFNAAGRRSFFSLPEWYDLLGRCLTSAGSEIRVYTDERRESMLSVPLQIIKGDGRNCFRSLANFYSIEHGILAAPNANVEFGIEAILSEIATERPRWDRFDFTELDPNDPSYRALVRCFRRAGAMVECTSGAGTWYERTDGIDFADYLNDRPTQLLNTWQRKRKKAKGAGTLSSAFLSDASWIERAIAEYNAIYSASWKSPEPFPQFIPGLLRLAAELGALRLGVYYMDGIPAATQFWIVWGRRAIIYKLAHDKRFDSLSLGTLLTMDMIERVLRDDRPHEINFGRGDDAYKRMWLPRRRQRCGITAANLRTLPGLRLALEREAAKVYHWFCRQ